MSVVRALTHGLTHIKPSASPVRRFQRSVNLSLYLVTCRAAFSRDSQFIGQVMGAVKGGVTCVQIRDRCQDLRASIRTARILKQELAPYGVPLIINDRVDVALAVGAEGVHLGQHDFPISEARQLLGKNAIIGLSVDTWDDVVNAQAQDVDYLGVQVFPSRRTKPDSTALWRLDGLRRICRYTSVPVVAIGGVDATNVGQVSRIVAEGRSSGEAGVAFVGDPWYSKDPFSATQRMKAARHSETIPSFRTAELRP